MNWRLRFNGLWEELVTWLETGFRYEDGKTLAQALRQFRPRIENLIATSIEAGDLEMGRWHRDMAAQEERKRLLLVLEQHRLLCSGNGQLEGVQVLDKVSEHIKHAMQR